MNGKSTLGEECSKINVYNLYKGRLVYLQDYNGSYYRNIETALQLYSRLRTFFNDKPLNKSATDTMNIKRKGIRMYTNVLNFRHCGFIVVLSTLIILNFSIHVCLTAINTL